MANSNNTLKELDIVKYIDPENLEKNKPAYGTGLDKLYGIVRDVYKNIVYVEFFGRNNKSLDIEPRQFNEVEKVGSMYELITKGLAPAVVVKPSAAKDPVVKKAKVLKAPKTPKKKEATPAPVQTTPVTPAQVKSLGGLRILPTGLFDNFSRQSFVDSIVEHGGIYGSGGVNKKLDILVVGRAAGPAKLEKARQLGIKMINEQDYLAMIS